MAETIKVVASWGTMENPFIVPTPKPYIPYQPKGELDEQAKERLLHHCKALWKALDMLGISSWEAHQKDYTLNRHTHDELYHAALRQERYDVSKFLRNNSWA